MYRKQIQDLTWWFSRQKHRKPLIIRGARQVGKSTLVRLFCQEAKLDLLEVNLEKIKFKTLQSDHFKIEDWLQEIEVYCQKKFNSKSVIFLDEIQAQPEAVAKLRYFFEDAPQIPVLAAGSLLELMLHQEKISFPVGRVSFLWVGPMTFSEFLMANKKNDLAQFILKNNVPEFAHSLLNDEVKKYFYIGGMPAVIKAYTESNSFIDARREQVEILNTYKSDFPKYGQRFNLEKLNSVYEKIPYHLAKKIIYQKIDPDLRSVEIKKIIEILLRANICSPSYHSQASGLPLRAGVDFEVKKLYFLDIGLVNCVHDLTWKDLTTYFEQGFTTKGFIAEQFVAQHLGYGMRPELTPETLFWLKDKDSQKAEIDFLIQDSGSILPIEVKSGKGGRLKSLEVFCEQKKISKAIKFSNQYFHSDLIKKNGVQICKVQNWPYYSVEGFMEQNRSAQK